MEANRSQKPASWVKHELLYRKAQVSRLEYLR
jgi:hypothetical protein